LILSQPNSILFPYTTLFRSKENILNTAFLKYMFLVIGYNINDQSFSSCLEATPKQKKVKAIGAFKKIWQNQNLRDSQALKVLNRSEEHTSELQSRFDIVCRL